MSVKREIKILFVKEYTPGMVLANSIAELGLVEDWDDELLESAVNHVEEQFGHVLNDKTIKELEKKYG